MNLLLTFGLASALAAFGAVTVLLLDARSRHLDALRRTAISAAEDRSPC